VFSPPAAGQISAPLQVGPVSFPNRVLMAPMAGITDRPFRQLASRFGAGVAVSEMVAGGQLISGHERTRLRAEATGVGLHVVQLAGREAAAMADGARAAGDAGADIIDINMGCPAKKVTSGLCGSALMRDLDHALTLIDAVVGATDRPVTLKMRLGWDETTLVAPALARRAESAGVAMVTVHGRTRCQFYAGAADWTAIRAVKAAVSIPVIANGDITGVAEAETALRLSGADGIMIGRAARGQPWFPGALAALARTGILPAAPTGAGLLDLIREHYDAMLSYYGIEVGRRVARKHLGWYLDRLPASETNAEGRAAILRAASPAEVDMHLATIFAVAEERMAA
jgi:tRNA-dihydrouridine synthase B